VGVVVDHQNLIEHRLEQAHELHVRRFLEVMILQRGLVLEGRRESSFVLRAAKAFTTSSTFSFGASSLNLNRTTWRYGAAVASLAAVA